MPTHIKLIQGELTVIVAGYCNSAGLTVVTRTCDTERELYCIAVSVYTMLLQKLGNEHPAVIDLRGIVKALNF